MLLMGRHYTGVGSRETPAYLLDWMTALASWLDERGCILRSGGAPGADSAFEAGARNRREIFLPWARFNGNSSPLYLKGAPDECKAVEIAQRIHPAWGRLSQAARRLHARNAYQVLGSDLAHPSGFLICWTPNAADVGGTRTAIMIAREYDVPVFNVADARQAIALTTFLQS